MMKIKKSLKLRHDNTTFKFFNTDIESVYL